jgi:uncharacterized membrane protein YhhN
VIIALTLLSELVELSPLEFVVKPLLMPGLLFFLYLKTRGAGAAIIPFTKRIAFGLIFSWFGDILLMFSGRGELFFMGGLVSFLLAHFFYIAAFLYSIWNAGALESPCWAPFLRRRPWWTVPFVLLLFGLYGYLYGGLGEMRVPVLIYAVTILTMAALALNRKGCVRERSFWPIFIGSLLFVVSDAVLAANKFADSVPEAGFIVMATYIAAQCLIAEGAVLEAAGHHQEAQ